MKFVKRLIELAFIIFIISLFMKNKDVDFQLAYFGLSEPIKIAFWELVIVCVSIGIIIAALGDLVTQLKWRSERRTMVKSEQDREAEIDRLKGLIKGLEAENQRLTKDLEAATKGPLSLESTQTYSDIAGPTGSQSEV